MDAPRTKFQNLLRELFQFDCADLDFGIYRIMNQKRAVIERFIEKDLLDAVAKELKRGTLKAQGELAEQLASLTERIREDIADDAVDADGNLDEKHKGTKLGRQYQELREKAGGAGTAAELEAQVFNHLWSFFSRYFDNGDFLSMRRYSRREKYAIPYNGEEVYLHWANKDQYYIKTGENFTDYLWRAGEWSVLFKLVQAETEKDNVKAEKKRLFVPRLDGVAVDGKLVTIPFEYRGPTEQEAISYGKQNQQKAILAAALESLPKRKALKEAPAALAALLAEYRKTPKGESVSRLEHHLTRYTAKNTRDYFIHKDLEGFLTRELDFYLKNEVLALDDLAAGGAERAEGWFQLMQAIRSVGTRIVAFLAQIEAFQKRVFEKRKFVTETHYCITLDRVPKGLWPKVLKNKGQIGEWQRLYGIEELKGYSEPLKETFLKAWPSMMVDTKFFADDKEFTDTLLAAQENLEEGLGGLLVHSENFQALNLLQARFKEQVKCIYIDPPYNTGQDDFLYKDQYQRSSWLSFMFDRIVSARHMLSNDGLFFSSIDFLEESRLREIADQAFLPEHFLANIIWEKRFTRSNNAKLFSTLTENILAYRKSSSVALLREPRNEKADSTYSNPDNDPRGLWTSVSYVNPASKIARPNLVYPLKNPVTGQNVVHPTNAWKYEKAVYEKHVAENRLYWGSDGGHTYPRLKLFLSEMEGMVPVELWKHQESGTTDSASKLLEDEFGAKVFEFPKPPSLMRRILLLSGFGSTNGFFVDFFAGTAPIGHAVIDLNRSDDGNRKYALVEMGNYFDSVMKPRMEKIVFASEWKDGKPVLSKKGKADGISHAFKYIRLESYEDALGNIAFDEGQGELAFEDYVLRYMLGFETRKSATLLNVAKLTAPFAYKLEILEGGERKTKAVDLPETFNYLLGLKVSSRKVLARDGKRYLVYRGTTNPHGEGGERSVVVIWRDVTGWNAADFKADAVFVKAEKLAEGADDVYVNADGVIEGARVLDGLFKERMFAPVDA